MTFRDMAFDLLGDSGGTATLAARQGGISYYVQYVTPAGQFQINTYEIGGGPMNESVNLAMNGGQFSFPVTFNGSITNVTQQTVDTFTGLVVATNEFTRTGGPSFYTPFSGQYLVGQDQLTVTLTSKSSVGAYPTLDVERVRITDLNEPSATGIKTGDTVYITEDSPPKMPKLKAEIVGGLPTDTIQWRLENKAARPERKTLDDRQYPIDGGVKTLPGDQPWDIDAEFNTREYGSRFFGGEITLYYAVGSAAEKSFKFKILGKNPDKDKVNAFIDSYQTGIAGGGFRYAKWILWHESGGFRAPVGYKQFNAPGQGNEYQPNYGAPDGWGIGQIDRSRSGGATTTEETWNWQQNVCSSLLVMQEKVKLSAQYHTALANTVPVADLAGLPVNVTIPGTHTSLTAQEASQITLYNGGSFILRLNIAKPKKNAPTVRTGLFPGAWSVASSTLPDVFTRILVAPNPNLPYQVDIPGTLWTLVPNSNNYVYRVVSEAETAGLTP